MRRAVPTVYLFTVHRRIHVLDLANVFVERLLGQRHHDILVLELLVVFKFFLLFFGLRLCLHYVNALDQARLLVQHPHLIIERCL